MLEATFLRRGADPREYLFLEEGVIDFIFDLNTQNDYSKSMNIRPRIAILLSESESDFFQDILDGISKACSDFNVDLILFPARERYYTSGYCEYQHFFIRQLISVHCCDALIIITGTQFHHIPLEEFVKTLDVYKEIPMISLGIELKEIPSIIADNTSGLYSLLEHFYTVHSARKFAFVKGLVNTPEGEDRFLIFSNFLKDKNLTLNPTHIFNGDFSYLSGTQALTKYKDKKEIDFDVLIASNDDMGYGCIDYLYSIGVTVPEDLLVAGYDDSQRAINNHPTLTTVNQGLFEQGYKAVVLALDSINKKEVPLINTITTKPRYRQTCGCIALNDYSINSFDEHMNKILFTKDSFSSRDLFKRRIEATRLKNFLNLVFSNKTFPTLIKSLRYQLLQMNIDAAAICLFDETIFLKIDETFILPHSVRLVFAFDEQKNILIDDTSIEFNPYNEFLPVSIFEKNFNKLIVNALYHGERLLGYFIFRPGEFSSHIYEIFSSSLSLLISTSLEFTKKENEKKGLTRIAQTDELTQLYNRRGYIQLTKQLISLSLKMNKEGLIIYADMDDLKHINDTYGHIDGDTAIKAMASILKHNFRDTDIIARLGGDEFVITAINLTPKELNANIDRINAECKEWNKKQEKPIVLSITFGYTVFSNAESNLNTLLELADKHLYTKKMQKKLNRADKI